MKLLSPEPLLSTTGYPCPVGQNAKYIVLRNYLAAGRVTPAGYKTPTYRTIALRRAG